MVMKQVTLVIFMFFLFFASSCTKDSQLSPKKIIISGKIKNLDKHSNKTWLEIVHPDLFAIKFPFKQVEIDSNGLFRYETELVSPSLCWGIYNKWFPFIISPGDSLYFSIDANILNDKNKSPISKRDYIKISGTTQDDYNKIIKFQQWASDSIYTRKNSTLINEATKAKSFEEFKTYMENRENEIVKQIEKFGQNLNAGKLYYDILSSEAHYRNLNDLVEYWMANPYMNGVKYEEIKIPNDIFSTINETEIDDRNFFVQNKIDLIKTFQFLLEFKNDKKTYLDIRKNKEKATIPVNYFRNQALYISEHTTGITKDLCLHSFALSNIKKLPSKSETIYTSVIDLIQDPYARKKFDDYFKLELAKIKPQQTPVKIKQTTALDSIIKSNPDKVIYVDFWAPWCGPCMKEIPYSIKLKKEFKGKNVVFVYLASRCSEKSWKATIANKDIKEINHLLSNEDYRILTKRFDITGIPHFLLINQKGIVVSKNAPRPSNKNINSEINKLLTN